MQTILFHPVIILAARLVLGSVFVIAEVLSGVFLIFGVRLRASSALVAAMLVVFLIAIGTAMARGLSIECGCYSQGGGEKVGWKKVFEDVALLVLAIQIFVAASVHDVLPFSFEAVRQTESITPQNS